MPQPLFELGGAPNAPILHISPANGFVPHTYIPLLRPLMAQYRVVCLPPRALWDDQTPPESPQGHDWAELADDLVAAFEQYDLQNVVAVGHSFGGIATMLAVLRIPHRFKALALLDPTIFPVALMQQMRRERESGETGAHPLVEGALRRRKHFDSAEQVFERFRNKRAFAQWPDETLRLYAEHGTRPIRNDDAETDGVVLTWSPQWEAYYFSTGYLGSWQDVPNLNGLLPVLFMAGEHSDIFIPESVQKVREIVPASTVHVVQGHGHLFPQSAPAQTATVLQHWLKTIDAT